MRCIASLQKQQQRAAIRGWRSKEILTEDEVKCSLLTSPFVEPGNPSLSARTLIRSVGDSENRRCGVHNESGQSLGGILMRTHSSLILALFLAISALPNRAQAPANPNSNPAPSPPTAESDGPSWLFPVAKLDEVLPRWFHIGGEYRDRLEGPIGTGFANTSDFYVLDRLRVKVRIQPKDWLEFFGEVQDSRIFFNHHIPNANPLEDSWTLWQAFAQVGSSTSGWVDALAGRQVLLFGDERVIGPSEWLNVGRTFNVARVDLHHPGYEVSVFASSVVPGSNNDIHNAIPGNNLYGIYGSFKNIVPRATFEPYVLWRLAPGNFGLPETVGRGHLDEVTMGLHVKGTFSPDLD